MNPQRSAYLGQSSLIVVTVALLASVLATPAGAQTNPDRWMGELADEYGVSLSPMDQTLAQFIFPGSHDAGTYDLKLAPACDACRQGFLRTITDVPALGLMVGFLAEPWSEAQGQTIYSQLHMGSRAFDLRFFRATSGDVVFADNFVDFITNLIPGIGSVLDLTPIVQGEFYIHHTFSGPSSGQIFADIRDFLNEPGHDREIIILEFSSMNEGNAGMSPAAQRDLLRQMVSIIGLARFAPMASRQTTLREIQDAGNQVIVSWGGANPDLSDPADSNLVGLVWPDIPHAYAGTINNDLNGRDEYPVADKWDTEKKLFFWLEKMGEKRTNDQEWFNMYVQLGPDTTEFSINPPLVSPIQVGAPAMMARRFICNYSDMGAELVDILAAYIEELTGVALPQELLDILVLINDGLSGIVTGIIVEETLDEAFGVCTAINDDWDRFKSLQEVAAYTNSKMLPQLVGLPRSDVNIVMTDWYPPQFTTQAMKLNRGAARVTFSVKEVVELEPHFPDFLTLSDPDYFPRITFVGDEWPVFGGPWLETTGTRITPNWRAMRGLPAFTPSSTIQLRLWDQNNEPIPDTSSQINGDSTLLQVTETVWTGGVVNRSSVARTTRGDTTGCTIGSFPSIPDCQIEFDSSSVSYSVHVCQWAPPPGGDPNSLESCDFDWTLLNTPPVAALEMSLISYASRPDGFLYEGLRTLVDASNSSDPDAGPPLNNPLLGFIRDFEFDCEYDATPVCVNDETPDDFFAPVSPPDCGIGYTFSADGFISGRGCRNQLQDTRGLMVFNPRDGICVEPGSNPPLPINCDDFADRGKQMTMAVRVTDMFGLSDIATVPYPVLNTSPQVTRFELTQDPGPAASTVTVRAEFYDDGADDSLFQCRFFFNDGQFPGDVAPGLLENPTVDAIQDPAGQGWMRTFYNCSVTRENLPPGSYQVTVGIEDKDFGDAPFVPFQPFVVPLPPVSATTDGAPGSLRNIILLSSANDVISFDPSLSGATIVLTGGEIDITKELTIDASNLPDGLTIDANGFSRVFDIAVPTVLRGLTITGGNGGGGNGGCIRNLALAGTDIIDTTITGCAATEGGGIWNSGQLNIVRSTISNSTASSIGGGIYTMRGLNLDSTTVHGNSAGSGGGLFAFNTFGAQGAPVNITNSTFSDNSASGSGGAISFNSATPTITHSTIVGNRAVQQGGGIYHNVSGADLVLENNVIAGNTARNFNLPSGPDIWLIQPAVSAIGNNLIGINESVETAFPAGALAGTRATPLDARLNGLSGNLGPTLTMMPFLDSPAIDNAVFSASSSPPTDQRGFDRMVEGPNDLGAVERLAADVDDRDPDNDLVDVTIDNCPLVRNEDQADTDMDGTGDLCEPIANLSDETPGSLRDIVARAIDGHVITFDAAASGGTINLTGGPIEVDKELTIDASSLPLGLTLSGNNASRVFNVTAAGNLAFNRLTIRDGQAVQGGCINNSGVLDIVDSTVTGCHATLSGGAIVNNQGSITVTNTTVSGNSQVGIGAFLNFGTTTLVHSTITDNHASGDPDTASGGIGNFSVLNIENSIIAGNTGGDNPDIWAFSGSINVSGANLVGDNSSVTAEFPAGPLVGTAAAPLNAALNRLGDNGGPTPTMVPAATSPAIDAAFPTGNSPMSDQRGILRPEGAASDLGAVERTSSDVDPDTDGDGQIDAFDTDDDNDGVPDESDDYPLGRFDDARPGDFAFRFIEALARAGITGGCSTTDYCPGNPVTRAQMAVFLERGMNGSGFVPPAATGAVFGDVAAGDFAAAFIEQLFADGITGGCGGGNYCPTASVTRGQMAVFLLRARYGAAYAPPPATGVFGDVPVGAFADRWIEQLAAEGISVGCGSGNFCPANPVTRAQMAVFLVRTFGL